MTTLQQIKELLESNKNEEALMEINRYIEAHLQEDEAYFIRGNIYRKYGNWKFAIENYCEASSLNPNSPAVQACEAIKEILDFYHTDLYNP